MRSGSSGLLFILMACRYGDMLIGVGILVTLLGEYMSLCIMTSTPLWEAQSKYYVCSCF